MMASSPKLIAKAGFLLTILLLGVTSTDASGSVVKLTLDNFDKVTEGKNVFIKFFAPWCGHCRSMAEDWEKLANDFQDSEILVVAEVDCTSDEGKPVCEDFDIQGFPTVVHGDPLSAETYDGERTYEAMSQFARDHLTQKICSAFRIENCSEEQAQLITSLEQKSDEDLEAVVAEVESVVKAEEEKFDAQVKEIQLKYDQLVEDFNTKLDHVKEEYNFIFVEQILNLRALAHHLAASEEDEDDEEAESEL